MVFVYTGPMIADIALLSSVSDLSPSSFTSGEGGWIQPCIFYSKPNKRNVVNLVSLGEKH